jgi:hypothetical protein
VEAPKRPNKRKLQALITRCAKEATRFHVAEAKLAAYVENIYGCTWADVDADSIIDRVTGGCGVSNGMNVEEFDAEMRSCMGAD